MRRSTTNVPKWQHSRKSSELGIYTPLGLVDLPREWIGNPGEGGMIVPATTTSVSSSHFAHAKNSWLPLGRNRGAHRVHTGTFSRAGVFLAWGRTSQGGLYVALKTGAYRYDGASLDRLRSFVPRSGRRCQILRAAQRRES